LGTVAAPSATHPQAFESAQVRAPVVNLPRSRHVRKLTITPELPLTSSTATAMAENLQTIYKNCVCNLDTVDHLISSNIHFEFDGLNSHICSCSLPVPLNFECCEIPVTDAPIIFQVNGNVSSSDSIITSESGQPNESSFWVECRPDTISRVLWSRIPQSLESIARASKLAFNLSKLCKLNESGSLQLRIAWNPRPVQKVSICLVQNSNRATKIVWSELDRDRQMPALQKTHYLCSFAAILVHCNLFSMVKLCK
jgi:hypothetical protein